MKTISEGDKLSLSECRKILNAKGCHYTDDQILKIREWIYRMAEFTVEFLENKKRSKEK